MMIGQRLKEARERKGLNQKQISIRLGVTIQTVSNWENNSQKMSLDHAISLAKILSCSLDYICGISDNITPNSYSNMISLDGLSDLAKISIINLINEAKK